MRSATRASSFVDARSRDAYLTRYDAMLQSWPAHEKVEVVGRYGRTTVLVAGKPGAPDLVLLHGRNTPSPSWAPVIGELAARYRVHAIDTMGEPGLSVNDGAPLAARADYVDWLAETLDALDLEAVHLCGYSFGGWLAASMAVTRPERLISLTLLDPAQVFAPFSPRWLLHCASPFLVPTRRNIRRLFRWTGQGKAAHRDLVELATEGMLAFRIRTPEAARIPAASLRSLAVPTQQLIAEHSVVHDPARAFRTAARLNPAVASHLVPDSSHFMVHDQPARVLDALQDLISRTQPVGQEPGPSLPYAP